MPGLAINSYLIADEGTGETAVVDPTPTALVMTWSDMMVAYPIGSPFLYDKVPDSDDSQRRRWGDRER